MQPNKFEDILNKDGFYVTHLEPAGDFATQYDVIFTALHPCELLMAAETHRVAGTNGSPVTLNLEKLAPGVALGSGENMLNSAWSLKTTADTPVIKTSAELAVRQLAEGDRIGLKDAGTLTNVAGVQITLYFKRSGKGDYR